MSTHTFGLDNLKIAGASGSHAIVDPRTVPPGTGPDDPAPPPEPGSGRPYGTWNIAAGGAGYWNSTVKKVTPSSATNVLSQARAGAMKLFVIPAGPENEWNPNGQFNLSRWLSNVTAMNGNTALEDAIADETAWACHLLDEPNNSGRYGGGGVTNSQLTQMAALVNSQWPGWRIVIRTGEPDAGYDIPFVTHQWLQYRIPRGDVTTARDNAVSVVQGIGQRLIVGLNVIDFRGSVAPGSPDTPITPSEYLSYGTILANADPAYTDGFMTWQYQSGPANQSGMQANILTVRNTFRALDP